MQLSQMNCDLFTCLCENVLPLGSLLHSLLEVTSPLRLCLQLQLTPASSTRSPNTGLGLGNVGVKVRHAVKME